jgi:hypothetical protein
MAKLKTTVEIIDLLGGTAAVARLTRRSDQQVSRWKSNGRFAPQTYLVMMNALQARGHWASPSLWQQVAIREPAA